MAYEHQLRRAGRGEPLNDGERRRLAELRGKTTLSDREKFERGALVGRARSGSATDQQLARSSGNKRRGVTARAAGQAVAEAVGDALVDAIDRELDRDAVRRRD